MRVTVAYTAMLLLPFVVGCEGNTPRRSPFAVTSVPTSAKEVEFAAKSSNPVNVQGFTGDRPARRDVPAGGNPNPAPVNPPAENPAAESPPVSDKTAMANARVRLKRIVDRKEAYEWHSAIFLPIEVGGLGGISITENNNFVLRTAEGLDTLKLGPAMSAFRATNGRAPRLSEFVKFLADNAISLPELKADEFYIYDPELAAKETSKENLDFLKMYTQ